MGKKLITGIILSLIISGCFILSGCSYTVTEKGEPIQVVKNPQLKFEVNKDTELVVSAISGLLVIRGTDGTQAEASMEIKCPSTTGECAEHFKNLEFETILRTNKVTIRPTKRLGLQGNRSAATVLYVPPVKNLYVRMNAGETKIYGVDAENVYVSMKVGDINIEVDKKITLLDCNLATGNVNVSIPENMVGEVDIDSNVGEATITRDGKTENASRSLLVGEQSRRFISSEGAIVRADVQVGDISIKITK